eukprot:6453160-Prymnesium_polylepis.1
MPCRISRSDGRASWPHFQKWSARLSDARRKSRSASRVRSRSEAVSTSARGGAGCQRGRRGPSSRP